jgi:hypothetical protein
VPTTASLVQPVSASKPITPTQKQPTPAPTPTPHKAQEVAELLQKKKSLAKLIRKYGVHIRFVIIVVAALMIYMLIMGYLSSKGISSATNLF